MELLLVLVSMRLFEMWLWKGGKCAYPWSIVSFHESFFEIRQRWELNTGNLCTLDNCWAYICFKYRCVRHAWIFGMFYVDEKSANLKIVLLWWCIRCYVCDLLLSLLLWWKTFLSNQLPLCSSDLLLKYLCHRFLIKLLSSLAPAVYNDLKQANEKPVKTYYWTPLWLYHKL